MLLPTLVNVLFAFVPRAVIAVMHTTIIRANITAYSTAVGPSSRARKFLTRSISFCMVSLLCPLKKTGRTRVTGDRRLRRRSGGVQSHVVKRVVGVLAQGGDGRDADHDDEGEHHCVFH